MFKFSNGKVLEYHEYIAEKYKQLYIDIAFRVAQESTAERTKVGCVILLTDLTVLHGFNGMPAGASTEVCEHNNVTKDEVIHAEDNAIRKLSDRSKLRGSIAFCTLSMCVDCAELLHEHGIKKVYYKDDYRSKAGIEKLKEYNIAVEKL